MEQGLASLKGTTMERPIRLNRGPWPVLPTVFIAVYMSTLAHAFDNIKTHPEITDRSVGFSQLDTTLKKTLAITDGINATLNSVKVINWLVAGSTAEDTPLCRAKNHFHNPLKDFTQSGVTDLDGGHIFCGPGAYSNVTWGTGFTGPQTNGGVTPGNEFTCV